MTSRLTMLARGVPEVEVRRHVRRRQEARIGMPPARSCCQSMSLILLHEETHLVPCPYPDEILHKRPTLVLVGHFALLGSLRLFPCIRPPSVFGHRKLHQPYIETQ